MPPGWRDIPPDNPPGSVVEVLDIAVGPPVQGFAQNINVLRRPLTPVPSSIDDWAKQSVAMLSEQPNASVSASHAEKECNGTIDGWRIESSGTFNGHLLSLVQTAVLSNGFEYVATYSRLLGTPPDAQALKALDTLCPATTTNGDSGA